MPDSITMKAIRVHHFGGPEVLTYEDVPIPEPGPGDLLVHVRDAGVNPGETKIRRGLFGAFHTPPFTLGFDFSGIVESLGPGTEGFAPGDAIYAYSDSTRDGANAEYVAVRASECAPKPQSLDFQQAASVPLAGLTAWQGIFEYGGLQEGQSILVHGAGGAVGSFAVQFAKVVKNARVYATATGPDIEWVRDLGADVVIDYKSQRFEEIAQEIDLIFDTIGGETQDRSFASLRRGGTLIATSQPPSENAASERDAHARMMESRPSSENLREIAALIDAGQVKTRVAILLPLAQAAKAHELLERGGVHGKVVLTVPGRPASTAP